MRAIHFHAYVPGILPGLPTTSHHMQPTLQCSQTQVSQGGQAAHQVIQVPRRMGEVRQNPTTAPKQIPIRGPRQGEGSTPPHTTSGNTRERDTDPTPTVHSEIPLHQPPVNSREPTTSRASTPEPDSTSVQSTYSSLSKAACAPNTQVVSHRTTPTFTSTDNRPRVRLRPRPHRATQTDPPQGRGHHNAIRSL